MEHSQTHPYDELHARADVKLAPMSTLSPERSGLKYGGTGSKKLKRLDVHFASLKNIIC
jgi:hypothetical protein